MTRYDRRFWMLAAGVAATAGYVDAIGFLRLGGFFVSFMSGNSTRLAVGLVADRHAASVAAALIAGFAAGVAAGTALTARSVASCRPAPLALTALLLALAAVGDGHVPPPLTSIVLAAAMGAANTVFSRDGEVSIGVTYMTGTLVKCVQRLTGALLGGPRWAWVPYLMLWLGLVAGACTGAGAYRRFGLPALWVAVALVVLLAIHARRLARAPGRTGA